MTNANWSNGLNLLIVSSMVLDIVSVLLEWNKIIITANGITRLVRSKYFTCVLIYSSNNPRVWILVSSQFVDGKI